MSIQLFQRPGQGTGYVGDLTPWLSEWRDTSRAIGGWLTGEGTVVGLDLADFFNTSLGYVLRRTWGGVTAWEGLVYELRLIQNGCEYVRSLAPEGWHNRVKVLYTNQYNAAQVVDWADNADSQAMYGMCEYMATLSSATATQAAAVSSRHLKEFAWPRGRMSGSLLLSGAAGEPERLTLTAAGFWSTLNWKYLDTSLTAWKFLPLEQAASSHVSSLLTNAQFVTAGRVESNSLMVRLDAINPQRIGDLLEQVAAAGDASGNAWQLGVYDRQVIYEPAPTTARYHWRDGLLWDGGTTPAIPELLRPGCLIYNGRAPTGGLPAGVSVSAWDDPRYAYVESVEFQNGAIRLGLLGDDGTTLLESQVRNWARSQAEQERASQEALERDAERKMRWWVNQWHLANQTEGWVPYEEPTMRAPGAGGVW